MEGALSPVDEESQQGDETFDCQASSSEQKDQALQPMDGESEPIDEA